MDPKSKEKKQQFEERVANKGYAGADDITTNLRRFAVARPDIFGRQTETETVRVPQPAATIDGSKPIIWDGQSQSITRTTANIAMMRNQQQNHLKEVLEKRGELDAKGLEYLNQQQNNQLLQSTILQKDM